MCTFVSKQGEKRESRVLHSLFCKFKTLMSFPEAAAFAWLDQADLGLSRGPKPSPLDGSSASHATCSTRGAALRRTARVPGERVREDQDSAELRELRKMNEQLKVLPAGFFLFKNLLLIHSGTQCWVVVKDSYTSTVHSFPKSKH